ncbi:MAG: AI-2E family transporter [Planctomycetota bacterium]|nr:AI-2E family transporter [Planctomycetota bacterium]MDA1262070.1 AI-2E family transporter [Planctomycetota bacterium]
MDQYPQNPTPESGKKDFARLHIWQVQAFRDLLVIALIFGAIWAGYALRFVTVPLLLAFTLAYLVEPLVAWLCRVLKLSRPVAVSAILSSAGLGVCLAGLFFIPTIVYQASEFVASARAGRFDQWINRFEEVLPQQYRSEISKVRTWINDKSTEVSPSTSNSTSSEPSVANSEAETPNLVPVAVQPKVAKPEVVTNALDSSTSSISQALLSSTAQSALWKILDFSSLLFAAVLIPFYFWFFSVGFPTALQFLAGLVPTSNQEKIFHLAAEMDAAVAGFVRGRILIAAGMGVMFAGGWWINGVPYALTLGLLAGILSIIPYLGLVVIIPAIALLAANQLTLPEADRMAWYWIIGGPPLVFTIVQSIEGYLLTPVFAGRATNLGPVSIFVAVLAGASVAGLYGMLLAIPVAACAKILIRETIMPSLRNWAAGKSSDPLPLDRY